jgi:hypothetical protein
MKYTVYFEIFGKKMKASVEADSQEDAKYKIMGKIKWHKFVKDDLPGGDVFENFKNIMGI